MFPQNLVADFAGGSLLCALGIVMALLERTTSGRGQVVDAAMVDGAMYFAHAFFKVCTFGTVVFVVMRFSANRNDCSTLVTLSWDQNQEVITYLTEALRFMTPTRQKTAVIWL